MDTLAGMTRTGEKVAGPASDLVELENDKGLKHLAITFHRKYRQHDAINGEVRNVRGFLEEPGSVAFRDGLSVSQAVALAGGPTDFAGTRAVVLRDGEKIPVNLRRIRRGAISDPILRPDDTLILRRSWL